MISYREAERLRAEARYQGICEAENGWLVKQLRKLLEVTKAELDQAKIEREEAQQQLIIHLQKNKPYQCDNCCATGAMQPLYDNHGSLGGFVCAGVCEDVDWGG